MYDAGPTSNQYQPDVDSGLVLGIITDNHIQRAIRSSAENKEVPGIDWGSPAGDNPRFILST